MKYATKALRYVDILWVTHASILEINHINVSFVVNVSGSVDNLWCTHAPTRVRNPSNVMFVIKGLLSERVLLYTVEPMLLFRRDVPALSLPLYVAYVANINFGIQNC